MASNLLMGNPRCTQVRSAGSAPMRFLLVVLLLLVVLPLGLVSADAPATPLTPVVLATPPMGVNNWNATGCTDAFDEAWVRAQADALVTSGLRERGYRYVDLDDCWAA